MARGQSGSLLLSLYDSFIHYFTPVYPDAIHEMRVSPWPHMVSPEMKKIASLEL
jgi:hypothetical protein